MMHSRRQILLGVSAVAATSRYMVKNIKRNYQNAQIASDSETKIEVFNSTLLELLDQDQKAKMLGAGYQWSEGPAWDKVRNRLYFTDVPSNKAYVWSRQHGVETFLDPSGIELDEATGFREPGANGLLISDDGRLLICNHGKRAVEAMDIATGKRLVLVSSFKDKAFNSPNDLIEAKNGDIYFTDPPYGLKGLNQSPLKEQNANGVYRLTPSGDVKQIVADMTFPNGIAMSPDEKYLFISQSDPDRPLIRRVELATLQSDKVWFDVKPLMQDGPGLPDGMAVTVSGHIFATGPGGVLILNPNGDLLGRINTGRATANCAFGEDGYTLFITAHDRLLSIRTKTRGIAWA